MNQSQRALQIWPILINAAHNRQVLNYQSVGDLIGMPPIALTQPLGLIMNYCAGHQLPPLTLLVVGKETGRPGPGLTTVGDPDQDRENVFSYNWYGLKPVEEADLVGKTTTSYQKRQITDSLLDFEKQIDPDTLIPTLVPEAEEFVINNPYAFAMAISLDRGTKAEIIWTIPYYIYKQLGHLDPYEIDLLSLDELAKIISLLPKKPRYKTDAPRTIKELTSNIISDYEGEASKIWTKKSASEVNNFFQSIFGVGPGIANMAVLLIEKAYNIKFSDLDRKSMDIKPDVHTMRVLYRLGAAEEISEDAAVNAARKLNPDFPGEIDGPLWTIGREWCFAQNPECSNCPMGGVCRKINV